MAATLQFGGKTVILAPGFQPPKIAPQILFDPIPRTSITYWTDMGESGGIVKARGSVTETDFADANTEYDDWVDLIGTSGTLSWDIQDDSGSIQNVVLVDVDNRSRCGPNMSFDLHFRKVAP